MVGEKGCILLQASRSQSADCCPCAPASLLPLLCCRPPQAGVVCGNEAVWTVEESDGPAALLGMDLVRLGLERGNNAEQVVEVMAALLEAHGQGGACEEGGELKGRLELHCTSAHVCMGSSSCLSRCLWPCFCLQLPLCCCRLLHTNPLPRTRCAGDWTYHNRFLVADAREAWVLETAGRCWVAQRITQGGCG